MQQLNSSHPAMACISNFSLADIETYIKSIGEHNYRSKQIFTSLYDKKNIALHSFDAITVIPKYLREQLSKDFGPHFRSVTLKNKQVSKDGTCKMLFSLLDDTAIETVLIPSELVNAEGEPKRKTLCISTQAGCALGCAFCATATLKLRRNLAVSEIVDQFMAAREICDTQITNIVFMGMGEPLDNFDNVVGACKVLVDSKLFGLSKHKVTVSTSGLLPEIAKLGQEVPVALAISLHTPYEDQRSAMMPVNKKYPLSELKKTLLNYPIQTRHGITFEYVMIKDVNDSLAHAKKLVHFLHGLKAKVNLIPMNPHPGSSMVATDYENMRQFQKYLSDRSIPAPVRYSRAQDVSGACGQLASKRKEELNLAPRTVALARRREYLDAKQSKI